MTDTPMDQTPGKVGGVEAIPSPKVRRYTIRKSPWWHRLKTHADEIKKMREAGDWSKSSSLFIDYNRARTGQEIVDQVRAGTREVPNGRWHFFAWNPPEKPETSVLECTYFGVADEFRFCDQDGFEEGS